MHPRVLDTATEFTLEVYDKLTEDGKAVCGALGIGPTHVVGCLLDPTRKIRITGTDLPKMLGLIDAKYGDFRTVVAEKLGLIEDDFEGNIPTEVGKFMEPFLLSQVLLQNEHILKQVKTDNPGKQVWITLGEHHVHETLLLGASTDAAFYAGSKLVAIWEMKHTAADWQEPPDKVIAQCQSQMMCSGLTTVGVMALTGGNRTLNPWAIELDPEWVERITEVVNQAEKIIASGHMPAVIPEPKKKKETSTAPDLTPEDIQIARDLASHLAIIAEHEAWIAENKPRLSAKFEAGNKIDFEDVGYQAYSYERSSGGFSAASYNKDAVKLLLKHIPEAARPQVDALLSELTSAHTKPTTKSAIFVFKQTGGEE